MKLRLLLFEDCKKNCIDCCNHDWDIKNLPKVRSFTGYDEIILTGGEPMLHPIIIYKTVSAIRKETNAPIFLYTAKVDDIFESLKVLSVVDGITITLHEQVDLKPFVKFYEASKGITNKSLRVNIFKEVETDRCFSGWSVKRDIIWIKNCPLPQDEIFMSI